MQMPIEPELAGYIIFARIQLRPLMMPTVAEHVGSQGQNIMNVIVNIAKQLIMQENVVIIIDVNQIMDKTQAIMQQGVVTKHALGLCIIGVFMVLRSAVCIGNVILILIFSIMKSRIVVYIPNVFLIIATIAYLTVQ